MKKILLSSVLLLSACVSNRMLFVEPTTNTPIYEVQCNAYNHTIGDCYAKAAEVCPNGFINLTMHDTVEGVGYSQNTINNSHGTLNFNTNANAGIYGNNIRANSYGNATYNGYNNAFTLGGAQLHHQRSMIYACKP